MGKFKNFFVEEVEPEIEETNYDCSYEEEESVDVNTENVSQESLIADIYANNELSDTTKSIFKIEELINSLPKEMPDATKKTTVLSMLGIFQLSVEDVLNDAENRLNIINAALSEIESDNNDVISRNVADIEQKKVEIQQLEKDNADRSAIIKNSHDKIESETKRIDGLMKFIGGEM